MLSRVRREGNRCRASGLAGSGSRTADDPEFFFFQAEDGTRDVAVTGVQTCALPILGLAYSAMQPCRAERSVRTNDPSLENCILLLDCRQRAVFITPNVLRMSWPTVAGASGSSVEEIGRASCRERV